jgi:bifunctional ADP-heptose synthase (sugar kinase/adenylyltransferase)
VFTALLIVWVAPVPVYVVAAIATRPSGTANVVAMIRC